ncbi:MAG TPA: hypothetical protein VLD40_07880 [Dissulfurispiraceae bacterium]|nr:hypothetical protein [Dissulfurispiraceae bacterium]
MSETAEIDVNRGREIAPLLIRLFGSIGIHGKSDRPEDAVPSGIVKGSTAHLMFITLTIAIGYQRDASSLWESARSTYLDSETRYLFDSRSVSAASLSDIRRDLKKHGLSKKTRNDAYIWKTNAKSFYRKWAGDPCRLLESCGWDCLTVLARLEQDHHQFGEASKADYPYLRDPMTGSLWLRMLRDDAGLSRLKNLDRVALPVDIHIARATLTTGVVRGRFKGNLTDLFGHIRETWFESVRGLTVRGRPMVATDLNECLWNLSKHGCSKRHKAGSLCPVSDNCAVREFCVSGVVSIENGNVELDT